MTRRSLNTALSAGASIALLTGSASLARNRKPLLGFKQYGMKKFPVHEAIRHIAGIGYKALSLTLMPTWDTEPKLLSRTARAEIRKRIDGLGLVLSSVQESLPLGAPDGGKRNLERLRAAAEAAHELSPSTPAVIETPAGGRPEKWIETRNRMADELALWAKTLEPLGVVLAIEGHVGTALDMPAKVLWLLDQVKSPSIGNLFDYSHYHLQRLDLDPTLRQLAGRTVLHHIKDSAGNPEHYRFLLPGDSGEINYREYARVLGEIRYQGTLLLEVSAQIFNQPGYDGLAAAQHCWNNMAPYFA
ncbi:MAG: hypothetical protein IANPNBLG_02598 [Bryobacteraceae bacterium]|nr:hypothetical protein [Bryobacteraceae bacterium]